MTTKRAADLAPGDRFRASPDNPFREVVSREILGPYVRLELADEFGDVFVISRMATEEVEVWTEAERR